MVIDHTSLSSAQTTGTRGKASEHTNTRNNATDTSASSKPASAPVTGDTVKLSDAAQSLQSVNQQLGDIADVDQEKVARIKAAIEEGSYQVDFERTAQRMLDLEGQLG